jgi:hypothetical protein
MKDSFDKTWDEAESELAQKIANNEAREWSEVRGAQAAIEEVRSRIQYRQNSIVDCWNEEMRVLELLITCSSNPCIFSWLVFLLSCDFGAEEVICDDSGEEGDVFGVDGLLRSSFLSVALVRIAFLTLARVLFHMSISSNYLQSCFLSVPDISFALLSFLYSFKMALYFFL